MNTKHVIGFIMITIGLFSLPIVPEHTGLRGLPMLLICIGGVLPQNEQVSFKIVLVQGKP